MRSCIRARVLAEDPDGTITSIDVLDMSLVEDEHEFGRFGDEVHIPGGARPVASPEREGFRRSGFVFPAPEDDAE